MFFIVQKNRQKHSGVYLALCLLQAALQVPCYGPLKEKLSLCSG